MSRSPAYAREVPDLSQYSTIFIGAPVWWGDWPMIMYTFFENNKEGLAGKTLIPFSTHEGSGLSGFDKKLSSACPDATVLDGLAIRGNSVHCPCMVSQRLSNGDIRQCH